MDVSVNPNIIKDPALVNERIFVGNLPLKITRDELESICTRYGNVLCSMVQKNFGFVQFDSEETADKAAAALHGSTFKGNRITVRNAGKKKDNQSNNPFTTNQQNPQQHQQQQQQQQQQPQPQQKQPQLQQDPTLLSLQQQYHATVTNPSYNDCEIIVVNKQNTEYAEYIEQRLRRLYLKVDLLFPNEEVPIGKVLGNISSRGCLYAVLVTPQNQERRSITVNILYGERAAHCNIPVDDGINLIAKDFQEKLKLESLKPSVIPMAVPIIPPVSTSIAPPLKERHPEAIQSLLNLLADNLPLTVLQYDRIIKYLNERRELQVKAELGDAADLTSTTAVTDNMNGGGGRTQPTTLAPPKPKPYVAPDPEIELQKKLLNILNKSSITDSKPELVYPDVQSLKNDESLIELLKDEKIQNAMNSLMTTNLVSTIENYFKF